MSVMREYFFPLRQLRDWWREWRWRSRPDTFITGTGQRLAGIHDRTACAGRHCVIHNPSPGPMRRLSLHWRDDRGLFERICMHGVGHPDPDSLDHLASVGRDRDVEAVHGCDGCCAQ